jgi:hypothetical protein
MNWQKGLLRLWVVATAPWIASVVLVCEFLGNGYEFRGVQAVELSAEYWYYRILHPKLVQAASKYLTPLYCDTQKERDEEEAPYKAKRAEEAKKAPLPGGRMISLQEAIALGPHARPVCSEAVLKEQDDLRMQLQQASEDVERLVFDVERGGWVHDVLMSLAYWLFGPPIAVFILGASLMWALRGFRAD